MIVLETVIVNEILRDMDSEDMQWLADRSLTDTLGLLHHSWGRAIRNHYNLWHTSPLTERWRTDESSHDIRGGVDYSEDHPDAVSTRIMTAVWKRLQG